jgi:hypothetical protein
LQNDTLEAAKIECILFDQIAWGVIIFLLNISVNTSFGNKEIRFILKKYILIIFEETVMTSNMYSDEIGCLKIASPLIL